MAGRGGTAAGGAEITTALIAEDQDMVREGFKLILNAHNPT